MYTLKKHLINLYLNELCSYFMLCVFGFCFIFMFIKVNEMGLVHLKWSPGDWCMCWTE